MVAPCAPLTERPGGGVVGGVFTGLLVTGLPVYVERIKVPSPMIRHAISTILTQKTLMCFFLCCGLTIARIRARLCCIAINGSGTDDCPRETSVAGPASERCLLRQLVRQRSAALRVTTKLSALRVVLAVTGRGGSVCRC